MVNRSRNNPQNTWKKTQTLLPWAKSSSSFLTVWRPSGFCCSDTATTRYIKAPPYRLRPRNHSPFKTQLHLGPRFSLARVPVNQFGFRFPRSNQRSQYITLCSLYLGVNMHCRHVKSTEWPPVLINNGITRAEIHYTCPLMTGIAIQQSK